MCGESETAIFTVLLLLVMFAGAGEVVLPALLCRKCTEKALA